MGAFTSVVWATDVLGQDGRGVPGPSDEWKDSDDFTEAVTGGRCAASFFVDLGRRVAVFDAVDPKRKNEWARSCLPGAAEGSAAMSRWWPAARRLLYNRPVGQRWGTWWVRGEHAGDHVGR